MDVQVDAAGHQQRKENLAQQLRISRIRDELLELDGQLPGIVQCLDHGLHGLHALLARNLLGALILGKQEFVHPGGTDGTIERDLLVAQQGFAEAPELAEIHVLLAFDHVRRVLLGWLHCRIERLMRLGLGQILQAMPARVRSELVEPYGIVDRRQIVVEQGIVAVLHDVFRLFVVDLREQAARFRDALRGVFDGSRVVQQDLTDHLSRVAAGIDVVADERDALGRQAFAADRQQAIAHVRRNPGVEAVGEDVIELAFVRAEIAQIGRAQTRCWRVPIPRRSHCRRQSAPPPDRSPVKRLSGK